MSTTTPQPGAADSAQKAENKKKKAEKIYASLSGEQKQFARSQQLKARFKLKHWINFFQKMALMDELRDTHKVKNFGVWLAVGIIVTVVGVIGMSFFLYSFILSILGAIGLVVLVLMKRVGIADIDNRFRQFIFPVVLLLTEEVNPESKLTLAVDLSEPVKKQNFTEQKNNQNVSRMFRYPKIKEYYYDVDWFKGQVQLRDGTFLDWAMHETVRKRNITKRSASGKIKTKNKFKLKNTLNLTISFPKSNYQLSDNQKTGQYKDAGEYHTFKVKRRVPLSESKFTFKIKRPDNLIDLNVFLETIATAYKNVTLNA